VLRQAVSRWEQKLGKDHEYTLDSKHWLGRILYYQKKYGEAEEVLGQAVSRQEQKLGKDHEYILDSKHWLGRIFYYQKKYGEAEEVFRQAVNRREQKLGKDHEDTLDSKSWLGYTLCDQKKYDEAEEVLRQAVSRQEQKLGKDHEDTLNSKYWLGQTLYNQKKYNEAEEVLQQVVHGQEQKLGKDHEHTLYSKYRLGKALYYQKKYGEAGGVFQQAVSGQEWKLGKDHKDTLNSKSWLEATLYAQRKYGQAEEVVQQAVRGQEWRPGNTHARILGNENLFQKLQPASPLQWVNNTEQAITDRLSDFFPVEAEPRAPYTDSEIYKISSLLKNQYPRWSTVPRTYIILRTIGYLNLLDKFIDVGFSDHWFPVTERRLPNCLHPSGRVQFVNTQDLVLTKSIDLERGKKGQHCFFKQNDLLPFERKAVLGSGGFGEVDKVHSLISFKEYARKRVLRSAVFGNPQTEDMKQFIAEIEILKRLRHRHIVKFIGSYTDFKYIGLIMSPVAEMDLATYLLRADTSKYGELRTFFGCLAKALEFLHQQNIRHKDIKPGNILVHCGNVLFADFGLSFDFTATRSTTVGTVNGMTYRYCAPEVASSKDRNRSSDVWSLGVVFFEMITVLKGKSNKDIDGFFKVHGSRKSYVRTNPEAFTKLVEEFQGTENLHDNVALAWIQQMLEREPQCRPKAAELVTMITASDKESGGSTIFCGICCISPDDGFSDSTHEFEINA
jgi:serine/threonine protein kinase/tetratricopeptide (TPR) repeat protein